MGGRFAARQCGRRRWERRGIRRAVSRDKHRLRPRSRRLSRGHGRGRVRGRATRKGRAATLVCVAAGRLSALSLDEPGQHRANATLKCLELHGQLDVAQPSRPASERPQRLRTLRRLLSRTSRSSPPSQRLRITDAEARVICCASSPKPRGRVLVKPKPTLRAWQATLKASSRS